MNRWLLVLFSVVLPSVVFPEFSDEAESYEDSGATEESNPEADGEDAEGENRVEEIVPSQRDKDWLADKKTIMQIISPLRKYRESSKYSVVQRRKRKQQLAAALVKLNREIAGKKLSLKGAYLEEVEPEKRLTKYGLNQLKSLKQAFNEDAKGKASSASIADDWENNPFLAMMMGIYLMDCPKCLQETGRYVAKFTMKPSEEESLFESGIVPEFDGDEPYSPDYRIQVEIRKIINSETHALQLTKGKILPVSGTIVAVEYESSDYYELVKFYLK